MTQSLYCIVGVAVTAGAGILVVAVCFAGCSNYGLVVLVGMTQHGNAFGLGLTASGTLIGHFSYSSFRCGLGDRAAIPGVVQSCTLGFLTDRASLRGLAGGIVPLMTQCCALGLLADRAGLSSFTSCICPLVAQGCTLGLLADRAGLCDFTGCICPLVAQGCTLGLLADGAGLGGFAGRICPLMTQGCTLGLLADRAGLSSFTSCICPLVAQGCTLGLLADRAGLCDFTSCRLPYMVLCSNRFCGYRIAKSICDDTVNLCLYIIRSHGCCILCSVGFNHNKLCIRGQLDIPLIVHLITSRSHFYCKILAGIGTGICGLLGNLHGSLNLSGLSSGGLFTDTVGDHAAIHIADVFCCNRHADGCILCIRTIIIRPGLAFIGADLPLILRPTGIDVSIHGENRRSSQLTGIILRLRRHNRLSVGLPGQRALIIYKVRCNPTTPILGISHIGSDTRESIIVNYRRITLENHSFQNIATIEGSVTNQHDIFRNQHTGDHVIAGKTHQFCQTIGQGDSVNTHCMSKSIRRKVYKRIGHINVAKITASGKCFSGNCFETFRKRNSFQLTARTKCHIINCFQITTERNGFYSRIHKGLRTNISQCFGQIQIRCQIKGIGIKGSYAHKFNSIGKRNASEVA